MANLLLATISTLATPHFLGPLIATAAAATHSRLTIILFSGLFNTNELSHTENWDNIQTLLTFVYVQATKVLQDVNRPLVQVDVLLRGRNDVFPEALSHDFDAVFRLTDDPLPFALPSPLATTLTHYIPRGPSEEHKEISTDSLRSLPSTYPVVALGGTFDHLHAGHKILLSMAAWICNEKIIVGVTDDALLKSKSNSHLLEHIETRIEHVRHFLSLFKPGIVYHIVPISDVYGPTAVDPYIQALVVSKETLSGAEAIAKCRAERNLPPLETFVIDVISHDSPKLEHDDAELLKQTKMSSTFIREWIASQAKGTCPSA